jgi:hypothetical protein
MVLLLPLAVWGVGSYVAYQTFVFNAPFAFVQTQEHWTQRKALQGPRETLTNLLTFEPIRAVYTCDSPCFWGKTAPQGNVWLNMMFANPLYFLFALIMLVLGAWKKWLTPNELMVGSLLLLIPYVLQGYRICMAAQGRFASVVFPTYLVLGEILARVPTWLSTIVLLCSGSLMAIYAAMFTLWYWYY